MDSLSFVSWAVQTIRQVVRDHDEFQTDLAVIVKRGEPVKLADYQRLSLLTLRYLVEFQTHVTCMLSWVAREELESERRGEMLVNLNKRVKLLEAQLEERAAEKKPKPRLVMRLRLQLAAWLTGSSSPHG